MTDQPPPQNPYPGQQPPPGGPPPQPGQQPYPGQPHPGQQPYPGQQPPPGAPQPQPPGGPPPAGPQPDALLLLTVQGHPLTSSFVPPTITIDGYPAPATTTGTSRIPIVSGRHRLEASAQWIRRYGQASLDVDIPPNSTVEVFYAPPFHQFTDGAMGLTQQQRKGKGLMIGCFGGLALFVVLVVVLGVVAGMLS